MAEGYGILEPIGELYFQIIENCKNFYGESNSPGRLMSLITRGEDGVDITNQIRAANSPSKYIEEIYRSTVQFVQDLLIPGVIPQENLEQLLENILEKVDKIFNEIKSNPIFLGVYDGNKEQSAKDYINEMISRARES